MRSVVPTDQRAIPPTERDQHKLALESLYLSEDRLSQKLSVFISISFEIISNI